MQIKRLESKTIKEKCLGAKKKQTKQDDRNQLRSPVFKVFIIVNIGLEILFCVCCSILSRFWFLCLGHFGVIALKHFSLTILIASQNCLERYLYIANNSL